MTSIALVHDYLSQLGGAERVALGFAEIFPGAPLYTSLYQPDLTFPQFKTLDVRTSPLQRVVPQGKFRFAAPAMSWAFATMQIEQFDVAVVTTSGFAHHVNHPNAYVYCHTPPHFIYDLDNYVSNPLMVRAIRPFLGWLRRNDQAAARRHTNYVANSKQTAERIAAHYGKEVDVIYPPLGTAHLPKEVTAVPDEPRALIVARLMAYKRFDLAIEACARVGIPLTIVGAGPDEARLRSLAGPGVTVTGRLGDERVAEAFVTHSMVLMPGSEDFGFAPLEANYAGRPVVAINAGGARETVRDGDNGLTVETHDPEDWAQRIKEAVNTTWDPAALRKSTAPFQQAAFQSKIRNWVGV